MVTVRRQPTDGTHAHWRDWMAQLESRAAVRSSSMLQQACERAERCQQAGEAAGRKWPYGKGCLDIGLEMAEVLVDLGADTDILPAAVLYRAVREGQMSLIEVEKEFGPDVARLIEGVLRMAAIGTVLNPTRKAVLGQQDGQLDNVRKMLVAMVDDVRVALVKLAERTVIIRAVKESEPERQRKVAQEIFDIYAPLAHRLG
ncbi:MAG: HD domain-containing protein, partial [Pseudomonadales bacterium]|nr:HD domain-containing protein [Pseudomonadales bacterium]